MRNEKNEKYLKIGITALAVSLISITFYLSASNMRGVNKTLSGLTSILMPFVYGGVLAYVAAPLCNKLEKLLLGWFRGKHEKLAKGLSITLVLLLAVLIVFAIFLLMVPQVINSLTDLVKVLPGQITALRDQIDANMRSHPEYAEQWDRIYGEINAQIDNWVNTGLPETAKTLLSGAVTQVGSVFTIVKNVLIGVIVAAYLLIRRKQLAAQAKLMIHSIFRPDWVEWIEKEVALADRMFNGFFVGKLLDSAIIGVLCFIGCLIMGFKSSLLIAVIVGVTNIIPFFGPFIGAIPCALLLLLENPVHCLMFVIFILVLQQLDGNVIGPRILGNTTGLASLWVMFGIILFGGIWGISGMIIGVPLMAVIYDIIRQLTRFGLRKRNKENMMDEYNRTYHGTDK